MFRNQSKTDIVKEFANFISGVTTEKTIQNKLYYHNGSCIYLSSDEKKESVARSFCRNIGSNEFSDLYILKNKEEFNFTINKIKINATEDKIFIGPVFYHFAESILFLS